MTCSVTGINDGGGIAKKKDKFGILFLTKFINSLLVMDPSSRTLGTLYFKTCLFDLNFIGRFGAKSYVGR